MKIMSERGLQLHKWHSNAPIADSKRTSESTGEKPPMQSLLSKLNLPRPRFSEFHGTQIQTSSQSASQSALKREWGSHNQEKNCVNYQLCV